MLNRGEKMGFNNGHFAEKRYLVNPKDLRFTHADIKFTFTDPRHPSVRETASLLRYGRLSPNVLAPLHVSIDGQRHMWCDNNRRLFALRHAGIDSIAVVFDGIRRPINSLKSKLSDPAFMPRIRAEAPGVQILPPPPTSGRNAFLMQNEPSLAGSISARYLNRQPYNSHEDEEDEDELGAMFSRLQIKSTGPTCPTEKRYLVNPKDLRFTQADIEFTFTDTRHPSVRETASLLRYGRLSPNVLAPLHVSIDQQRRMWCDNNRRLFALRHAGVDSIAVVFDGTRNPINSLKSKLSDPAFMPRIRAEAPEDQFPPQPTSGRNACQMENEPSARYLNRQPYNSHDDEEEEDELGAMFSQLQIKSTGPTHREPASSKQLGQVNPDDSVFMPSVRAGGSGVRITKPKDVVFMPTILGFYESGVQTPPAPSSGPNACQMENGISLPGSVSAGYTKRQPCKIHQDEDENVQITKPKVVVFMPTILGFYESRVQIPPPPTSGRNACQMKNEPSPLVSVSAVFSNRQLCNEDEDEDEDEGKVECVPTIFCEIEDEDVRGVEPCLSPFSLFHDYDYDLYW